MKRSIISAVAAALGAACLAHAGSPISGRILRTDPTTGALVVRVERPDGTPDGNTLTIATDANTRVTIDGLNGSVKKLAANMRVVIRPFQGAATSISATVPPVLIGKVSSADANSIVVLDGSVAVTVLMDDSTRVIVDGRRAGRNDVAANVMVKVVPGAGVAAEVETKSPVTSVAGLLVSLNRTAGKIGVLPKGGQQVNFTVDARTRVTINGGLARFNNLAPGMDVTVKFNGDMATEISAIQATIRVGAGPGGTPMPTPVPTPGPAPVPGPAPRPPTPTPRPR